MFTTELEMIIEMIKDLAGSAVTGGLWALGGYAIFQLVTFLSTIGAILWGLTIIIKGILSYKDKPKQTIQHEVVWKDGLAVSEGEQENLNKLIKRVTRHECSFSCDVWCGRSNNYFHTSDLAWLENAVANQIEKDEEFMRKEDIKETED